MDRDARSTVLSRRARFVAAALAAAGIAAGGQRGDASADAGAADAGAAATASAAPYAPSADDLAAGRALAQEAMQLRARGDHPGALARLKRAYELTRNARLLVPLAEESAATEDFVLAIAWYEKLAASDATKAPPRDEIDRRIAELDAKVGRMRVTADLDGATVVVDGIVIGVTPLPAPLRVNPGEHRVRVSVADRLPVERTVTALGGDTLSLAFDMNAAVPYPCLSPPPQVCLSPIEPPRRSSCACDIVGGSK